jgi:deoxyribose-phosphate aldolase
MIETAQRARDRISARAREGAPADEEGRNPGVPLDLDLIRSAGVNRSAVERRVAALRGGRSVKGKSQTAWLLRAVTLMDLTTLSGDDTPGRVSRLCGKARSPVRADLLAEFDFPASAVRVGAVCAYHQFVRQAVAELDGSGIAVAAVSTGFPAGLSPFEQRVQEIEASVAAGADEIDVVITRSHALTGRWEALYDEIEAFRAACGPAHLKVILGTGELQTLTNVYRASQVAMAAGADFIKTSTGKESVNATLPVGLTMLRAIRDYHGLTGHWVGFKPAGGIRTARQSLDWMVLVREEIGSAFLRPSLFRFGASSLLGDIERQLEHHVTARYSATHRHPIV